MSFRYISPRFDYSTPEQLGGLVVENIAAVYAVQWTLIGRRQAVGLLKLRWWALVLFPFIAGMVLRRAYKLVDQEKPAALMVLLRVW